MKVFILLAALSFSQTTYAKTFNSVLQRFTQRLESNVDDIQAWPNFCVTQIATKKLKMDGTIHPDEPMIMVGQSIEHGDADCEATGDKKIRLRELFYRMVHGKLDVKKEDRCVTGGAWLKSPCFQVEEINEQFNIEDAYKSLVRTGYHWVNGIDSISIQAPKSSEAKGLDVSMTFFGWYYYVIPKNTYSVLNMDSYEVLVHRTNL